MKTFALYENVFARICAVNWQFSFAQNSIGIGTTSPHQSASLDITDTAQRTAIASPANGLLVYQTDGQAGVYHYQGGTWNSLANTAGLSGYVTTNTPQTITDVKTFTSNLFVNGNVGIGTTTPDSKLSVNGGLLSTGPGNSTAPGAGVLLSYETNGGKLQS